MPRLFRVHTRKKSSAIQTWNSTHSCNCVYHIFNVFDDIFLQEWRQRIIYAVQKYLYLLREMLKSYHYLTLLKYENRGLLLEHYTKIYSWIKFYFKLSSNVDSSRWRLVIAFSIVFLNLGFVTVSFTLYKTWSTGIR